VKKRILFIAPQPFFEIRGTPIAVKDMLEILSEKYIIDFVSYPIGKSLPIKNVKHHRSYSFGIKKVKIGFSIKKIILDVGLFLKSNSLIRENKYDYIHAVEEAAYFGVFLKKKAKSKLVYDMDSIMSEQLNKGFLKLLVPFMHMIEKKIILNSDLILAVSGNFRDYCKSIDKNVNFVEIFDVPQIKKEKIPESLKKKFTSKRKKVLYIGNNEKYQGVQVLEETAKLMPEINFFIVGTGKIGRFNNITYISQVKMEYVWGIMQLVDVLVSPRLSGTNTPMKIYTYMASGKPIVATDIPAHNILKDCGFICELNFFSLKEKILTAIKGGGKKGWKAKSLINKVFNFVNLKTIILRKYEDT